MCCNSPPPAPDYTPLANASKDAAQVSEKLGQQQLDESKRQFEANTALAKPIVDAQLQVMQQGLSQGDDYYNYMKENQRPVEAALQADSLKDTTARDAAERNAITNANTDLAGKVTDIGQRQVASGTQYADDLRSKLGGVTDRFGTQTQGALDRYSQVADSAAAQFGKDSGDAISFLKDNYGASMAGLDKSLGESAAGMKAAAMAAQGLGAGVTANSARHEGQINTDIGLYTSGNEAIRAKYGADIENDAGIATADARAGQANATSSAIRQALRYGINVGDLAKQTSLQAAQAQAAASNNTRTASTDKYRGLVGQGIGMRQNLMDSSNQAAIAAANVDLGGAKVAADAAGKFGDQSVSRAGMSLNGADSLAGRVMDSSMARASMGIGTARDLATSGIDLAGRTATLDASTIDATLAAKKAANDQGFSMEGNAASILAANPTMARNLRVADDAASLAKKMDVAGLYRGLTGASQGAYGMAVGAGSSANANGTSAGAQYLNGMSAGNSTIMGGRAMAMQGLTGILNNQVSYANANQPESLGSILGGLGGAAAGVAKLSGSDRRLKENISQVGVDPGTGLALYEFNYIGVPERRWRGVMADEVEKFDPQAVQYGAGGFARVDYGRLGIEMVEV